MEMPSNSPPGVLKLERLAFIVLIGLALWLFAAQCISLFVFPVHDSALWYSDESWLMREAVTHLKEGVLRFPEAKGTVLEHSVGPLLGVSWLGSLAYGFPILIFGSTIHAIDIGRVVTCFFAFVTLISSFIFLRKIGANRILAVGAILILLSSRIFFIASHSCRSDMMVGCLALLFYCYFALVRRRKGTAHSLRWWFGFGLVFSLVGWSVSPHLVVLLLPLAVAVMWEYKAFQSLRLGGTALIGALCGIIILGLSYYLPLDAHAADRAGIVQGSAGESLLYSIPLLRFYSRSVQVSNLNERVLELYRSAPYALLLGVTALVALIVGFRKWRADRIFRNDFVSLLAMLFGWLLLQNFGRTYMIHALPLMVVCSALVLYRVVGYSMLVQAAITILAVVSFAFGLRDSMSAYQNANLLAQSSRQAMNHISSKLHEEIIYSKVVVAEVPAFAALVGDDSLSVISDFFTAWSSEDSWAVMKRERVGYGVLLRSSTLGRPSYRLQEIADSSGLVLSSQVGRFYDSKFDYFGTPSMDPVDTLELVRFR
jgi:hypothetical protein